jgi:hypothetical protein
MSVATNNSDESVPDNRSPSGQFLKGCSGNPGGRPKVERDIRELAREHGPDAIKRLVQLMHSRNERIAVAACGAILDRAYGRAPQAVQLDADVGFRGSALLAVLAALPSHEGPELVAEQADKLPGK